jgi:hypothetical protein
MEQGMDEPVSQGDPARGAPRPGSPDGIQRVRAQLERLRARARTLLVTERVAWLLAAAICAVMLGAVLDFLIRSPDWLRLVGLIAAAVLAAWVALRRVLPAVRFRPSLTEIALRLERGEPGAAAHLGGVLASGMELADAEEREPLARPVVQEAARRFGHVTGRVLAPAPAMRALAVLLLAVVSAGVIWAVQPELARIGASRMLAPWAGAEWPKRTEVADVTAEGVRPLGAALPLRAALVKGPEGARIVARSRVIAAGRAGPIRRVVLTPQERQVAVESSGASRRHSGALYERLIEPAGLATGEDETLEATLEYWFESDDDRTETRRLTLVAPPRIEGATARLTPPRYIAAAGDGDDGSHPPQTRTLDMGPGSDERAAAPAQLAGTRIEVELKLNKAVPTPEDVMSAEVLAWLDAALGEDLRALATPAAAEPAPPADTDDAASEDAASEPIAAPDDASAEGADAPEETAPAVPEAPALAVEFDGDVWRLAWTLRQSVRMPVHPVDEHDIGSAEEAAYTFEAITDEPPTATVTLPDRDRSVLPTAIVDVTGEGRDDVGLERVWLERQVARRPAGSEGAPAEPDGEPSVIAQEAAPAVAPIASGAPADAEQRIVATTIDVTTTMDLTELNLKSGDEVWLTALAVDAYQLDGQRHQAARSTPRRLRIISEEELTEEVWAELASIRRNAIRLDDEQEETMRQGQRAGAADRANRAQAGLTERIASQQTLLDRVDARLKENGLQDEALDGILREADHLLEQAGRSSVEASAQLQQAAAEQAESAEATASDETARAVEEAQEDVRASLGNLIELLDQGEDIWAVKRAVERLLAEQRAMQQNTQAAGEHTTGKSDNQLTEQEREELQRLAAEQRSLAQKAADAVEAMRDREQEMRESDPAAAQAMAEAARTAERGQIAEHMRNASTQIDENQTNSAQGQQQQAMDALEQMLENLENTSKNRDEVLRRFLASLIDSLDALIVEQEDQLARLLEARRTGVALGEVNPPLDGGMTRLHANTLGVLDQAASGPRETAPVADLIEEAADAQAAAIVALRDAPINEDESQGQEELSLAKLIEAKKEAERLDQEAANRQKDRQREEIRKAYMQALKDQVALKETTAAIAAQEATRRTRLEARRAGEDQAALQDRLATLLEQTSELKEATMIAFAHERLDEAMGAAARRLGEGEADEGVLRRQGHAVRVLQAIVEALDDAQKKDEEFREQEGGGGGQNGGQGEQPLVPPMAELRLLRAMQQETADLTRQVGEAGDAAAPEEVEAVGRLQRGLADEAQALLERLSQQGGGAVPTDVQPGEPQ